MKPRIKPPQPANGSATSSPRSPVDITPSSSRSISPAVFACVAVAAYNIHRPYIVSLSLAVLAFLLVVDLIPRTRDMFVRASMTGRDQSKKDKSTAIPEPAGVIACLVFLIVLFCFIPVPFLPFAGHQRAYAADGTITETNMAVNSPEAVPLFPHEKLVELLCALVSISSMILLGFADDVFDIRWVTKIYLSLISTLPLILVYYANFGVTAVMVPVQLRPWLGRVVDLGIFYYLLTSLFCVFFTNSINLLAGINGVEVSTSLVIALSVVLNDALYLLPGATTDARAVASHAFSSYVMLPFVGVSAGLAVWNWYPAKVFVGDTYTYFAGITFASVAVLSHFTKTMMLFFLPQLFNFVLSLPQLFRIVPCPRHRLPQYVPAQDHLIPSRAQFSFSPSHPPSLLLRLILATASNLRLVSVSYDPASGYPTSCTNFTLLCVLLNIFGPMHERTLCIAVVGIQVLASALAFAVRYGVAGWVYDVDVKGDSWVAGLLKGTV
ncbi:hypothetical protein M427DRAFT_98755 [Gonapodya prolifera JEL478]|uniref:UDP-N-acetylglucosamine--dolichyl-phosphate N-acetylglucosaminephosphotransferase n=1 Tax=Gonapodya prolifera (strain JEL478) TaxID=1344416 RepID=A0A139AFD6_GONPJ|nr:hypothetical protein M427DRAFT_98755 [Gonapodya prolifera JEL478]|eukprot:KXS15542.1 hypothetical protein M427DRAFT_98755 [Gonapodya prolifera JEL478]